MLTLLFQGVVFLLSLLVILLAVPVAFAAVLVLFVGMALQEIADSALRTLERFIAVGQALAAPLERYLETRRVEEESHEKEGPDQ